MARDVADYRNAHFIHRELPNDFARDARVELEEGVLESLRWNDDPPRLLFVGLADQFDRVPVGPHFLPVWRTRQNFRAIDVVRCCCH